MCPHPPPFVMHLLPRAVGGLPWERVGLSFPALPAMGTDLSPPPPPSFSIHKMGTGGGLQDLVYTKL